MFKLAYYIFGSVLLGIASTKDNTTSIPCGAEVRAAVRPIHHHIAELREKQNNQHLAQHETLTNMTRVQVETLAILDRLSANAGQLKEKLLWIETNMNLTPVVPSGFKKMGSRYFYMEHDETKNWTQAERACRHKGGYLAAFHDQLEFDAIKNKLKHDDYWLGINNLGEKDEFVSVASGRQPAYLNWYLGKPYNWKGNDDCVRMGVNHMVSMQCSFEYNYICQLDNII